MSSNVVNYDLIKKIRLISKTVNNSLSMFWVFVKCQHSIGIVYFLPLAKYFPSICSKMGGKRTFLYLINSEIVQQNEQNDSSSKEINPCVSTGIQISQRDVNDVIAINSIFFLFPC